MLNGFIVTPSTFPWSSWGLSGCQSEDFQLQGFTGNKGDGQIVKEKDFKGIHPVSSRELIFLLDFIAC